MAAVEARQERVAKSNANPTIANDVFYETIDSTVMALANRRFGLYEIEIKG
jgi:hypothetical protein